jgi:hypothetical protein
VAKLLKRTKSKGGIADRIKPLDEIEPFLTMACYGKSGTGKTVFGSSWPKPILLLDIREEGEESIADVPQIDKLAVETWDDLEEVYWMLEAGSKYKSLMLDQCTAMQSLGMQKIREENNQKPSDVFSQRSWGRLGGLMQQWIYNFRELKKKEYHVLFNAHEKTRDAQDEGDERLAPSIGPNLTAGTASFLNGAVSVIGNTFIREEVDKKAKTRDVHYCMRVGAHAYYAAKLRRPVSAGPPPDIIVNPTFEKVMRLSKGESLAKKVKKV